ncbi:MAG: alpha/beta hydrolase [Betaproteobacteria bacterium]
MSWREMDQATLDAAYNNGRAVANSAELVADWERRSRLTRERVRCELDLRYGAAERNRIDLFRSVPGAPLLAYIHGGYWQTRNKEIYSVLAEGPIAHGIDVALIGYTLAPEKRMDGIVAEIHAALDFLGKRYRGIAVSGWSAGGHLTAMAMPHPAVGAGLAVSGLYDLEPIRHTYLNEKLKLDEAEAKRNSPILLPHPGKPLVVAYGAAELPELQRQSRDYAAAHKLRMEALEGHDHFTILEELASPQGKLTALARTLLGRQA